MKYPSFPFYVNNWLGSGRTRAMLPEQRGAYLELLCIQWNSEDQTITSDPKALARISGLHERWAELGKDILRCFEAVDGQAKLRNERLYAIHQEKLKYSEGQSAHGRAGMEKRWKGHVASSTPPTPADKPETPDSTSTTPTPTKRFVAPTEEEVVFRFLELGWPPERAKWEAPQFIARHTAGGWKVGKNPMKCWKAAAVTWKTNNFGQDQWQKRNAGGKAISPLASNSAEMARQ
jgi:uncharacterized protein YdaU (DUF1376 family)